MRAITPLGRGLSLVALVAIVMLVVAGSSGEQITAGILLVLAAAAGARACVTSGQGLGRLYDPEQPRRDASDPGSIAEAVARGQASGDAQAATYAEVMRGPTRGG